MGGFDLYAGQNVNRSVNGQHGGSRQFIDFLLEMEMDSYQNNTRRYILLSSLTPGCDELMF